MMSSRMKMISVRVLTLFMLSILMVACTTSPTGRKQFIVVSEKQAISSSKQAYKQTIGKLSSKGKVNNDLAQVERVNAITHKLIEQAKIMRPDTKNWAWDVKVIDELETVNAWCMAGGKMAIYTGFLNKIKPTDDELAQVMGHEISHALANHTAERMSVAMTTSLGLSTLAILAGVSEKKQFATALVAKMAIELPNSRASEREADEMGIELAARAGYNPDAAVSLWQKMEKVSGKGMPEFLSTHPSPGDRQKRLRALASKVSPYYKRALADKKS